MSPVQIHQQLQEALAHHRAGRLADAGRIYDRLLAVAPKVFDVVHLAGLLAHQQGRIASSLELLARARKLNPRSAPCAMRLGLALLAAGRAGEAEAELRASVEIQPDFVEGWDQLAHCLKMQDRLGDAIECHERVVSLKPDYAAGWYHFGLTLSLFGRVGDALGCHDRALSLDASFAKAHYGRAQTLQQSHRMHEAVAAYDRFLELEPDHHEARSYRLFALNYIDGISRDRLFEEHTAFGRAVGVRPKPTFPNSPEPERKLRVAILSPDLRVHSCAYFIEPLLQHLDADRFECCLYLDHFREDSASARFRGMPVVSVWRKVINQKSDALEATIRGDQPDILIDLAGHTGLNNRMPLYARHLAPVQVTYLGYPNTTGLPAIDYRLTDAVADPEEDADSFATERLVRFSSTAWSYLPHAGAPAVGPLPAASGGPVTFCCFNNLAKITDRMLGIWSRILSALPESRLLLKGRGLSDETVRARYLKRLKAAGLPLDRVDMLERIAATNEHLALYQNADVSLDTFPYHGTTTTCEALWMGVPVVTLLGDSHVSRVSASLVTAVGHREWIARDEDDYVGIAVQLASDRSRLATLRAGLRGEMAASPLMDHPGQARRFGNALRDCWRDWCSGMVRGSLRTG